MLWFCGRHYIQLLLLLLSRFSRVRLCATPQTVAHQAPPSLGFSRQEHWSGLPFPSPMHEREKWKWSHSVMSDSSRPHGLQPTRLLCPWDFPGKSTGVGCHYIQHSTIIGASDPKTYSALLRTTISILITILAFSIILLIQQNIFYRSNCPQINTFLFDSSE